MINMAIFQVPQFLDIKPKIFGPFDFKQFSYVIIDVILIFIFFKSFNQTLAIFLSFISSVIAFALAFVKINGLPASKIIGNFINYYLKPQYYIWKKNYKTLEFKDEDVLNIRKKINLKEKLNELTNKLITAKNLVKKEEKQELKILKTLTGEKIKVKKIDYL